jgi:hypothetical protein
LPQGKKRAKKNTEKTMSDDPLAPLSLTRMVNYLETEVPVKHTNLQKAREVQMRIGTEFREPALLFQHRTGCTIIMDDKIADFIAIQMEKLNNIEGINKYDPELLHLCRYTETFGSIENIQTLEIVYGNLETKRELVTRPTRRSFPTYRRKHISKLILAIMMVIARYLCVEESDDNLHSIMQIDHMQMNMDQVKLENSALSRNH